MEWVIVLGVLFLAYRSGALSNLGIAPSSAAAATPVQSLAQAEANQRLINQSVYGGVPGQPPSVGVNGVSLGIKTAASVGSAAASSAMGAASIGASVGAGAALGAATAGIGAAVAIFAALWSAHELRAKQATDENSAMNIGVQGFDSDIRIINQQYNYGQIDRQTAIQALQMAEADYWKLVGPHIQPGRNGCQSGQSCPPHPVSCTGSIGAACCVGCDPIDASLYWDGSPETDTAPPGPGAIYVLMHGDGVSQVKDVIGSKYGGQTRRGYTLTWQSPGSL